MADKEEYLLSLEDVLNVMPVGVLLVDSDGLVVESNHQVATLLGISTRNLHGMNIGDFWPESGPEILLAVRSGRQAAGLLLSELDGCFAQARPLPRDQRIWAVSVFDHRLWQPWLGDGPTLDPLTPYYKKIFESSSDGISIADSQGRLILVNEASASHVGVKREEIQGRHVTSMIEHGWTDDYITEDVIEQKKPVTRLIKHHRTNKHIFLTGTPIFSPDGQVHLVVINERDLTALFELQTSFKQQKEILDRFKDELTVLQLAELVANEVVAISPAMRLSLDTAMKLTRHSVPQVLITGESGTGKGLLAKFMHAHSARADEPFIHINCAALPESLLEAELFGYEKGTFTGAASGGRPGLFEVAGRGTAFLDEIGEMSLPIQAKLLTFLDAHEFRRLGGHKTINALCAITTATNQDLERLVEKGLFRQDLYYRLNVFSLFLPPLRERPEDLIELARQEVEKLNKNYGQRRELDPLALEVLQRYPFPGNVRELLNALHQAVLLSDSPSLGPFLAKTLEATRMPKKITEPVQANPMLSDFRPVAEGQLTQRVAEAELAGLKAALAQCRNTREMAVFMGISQAGVSRKLKKYGLHPPNGKRS